MPLPNVFPLRANEPLPPHWLEDPEILGRAVEAKRAHPPSAQFWQRFAELVQIGAAAAGGRVRDDDPLRAGNLINAIAAELVALTVRSSDAAFDGLGWPETSSRPARGLTARAGDPPRDPGVDGDRGQRRPAPDERPRLRERQRATPAGRVAERCLAKHTASLAAYLTDSDAPDRRALANIIDDFGISLRGAFRHQLGHPSLTVIDATSPGRDPP